MSEDSTAGNDFLAQTVIKWETANKQFEKIIRTTIFRFGIVLSLQGGALLEMYKPLKFGIAGYFGNGKQFYSWIHIDDLCRMIIYAMENENIRGTYNAVAPHPETNKNFMKIFAKAKRKFYLLMPVPKFVLKIMLGERAVIVLDGINVTSEKIAKTNFVFKYHELKEALENV